MSKTKRPKRTKRSDGSLKRSGSVATYVWEVHTRIPKPEAEHTTVACQMTVVADHIDQVWDYIATDRADERTELVALIRREPVVAVLPPNDQALRLADASQSATKKENP